MKTRVNVVEKLDEDTIILLIHLSERERDDLSEKIGIDEELREWISVVVGRSTRIESIEAYDVSCLSTYDIRHLYTAEEEEKILQSSLKYIEKQKQKGK